MENSKERYYRLKGEGKCVNCGIREPLRRTVKCAQCAAYQANYQVRTTLQRRTYSRSRHLKRKKRVLAAYGGEECVCCGEYRLELLSIDHERRDGAEHKRQIGHNLYWWLEKEGYPQDLGLRVLCFNCNCSLGYNGYCPHEIERQSAYLREVS
ncbi:hypothetical protein LCGC14_0289200 [marine sediment metagenome]|uniref:Uncharacterized protein n=1 Tax=marine sediment metagenome TaxID=412755 RepID=A0A0F9WZF6_9ZZZZ